MSATEELAARRQERILERLAAGGAVTVRDLSGRLGVSVDTVQRDLRRLEDGGDLRRVRGGAIPASPRPALLALREGIDLPRKRRLAAAACELVEPGTLVGLAGGTTMVAFAEELVGAGPVGVVTTNLDVGRRLGGVPGADVWLPGGRVHAASGTLVGAEAVDALRAVRVDRAFVSACSLHPEVGLSLQHREEAQALRALLEGAGSVVVLATADRLGTAAPYPVVGCDRIDVLLAAGSEDALQPFAALDVDARAV